MPTIPQKDPKIDENLPVLIAQSCVYLCICLLGPSCFNTRPIQAVCTRPSLFTGIFTILSAFSHNLNDLGRIQSRMFCLRGYQYFSLFSLGASPHSRTCIQPRLTHLLVEILWFPYIFLSIHYMALSFILQDDGFSYLSSLLSPR